MKLKDLGTIPFDLATLDSVYPNNKAIAAKAARLETAGDIIRLKRGLYVISPSISGELINEYLVANHLYGPSYVTMHSALSYYGLIPESVNTIISMTTELSKRYINKIGNFSYIRCNYDYFSIGVVTSSLGNTNFLLASPEKSLCDLMIYTRGLNLRYISEIRRFLEEDIRFDMSELSNFNLELMKEIRRRGMKKNMISQLIKLIEYERTV